MVPDDAASGPTIRRAVAGDIDRIIDVYLAATIPGQSFLPESFWRDGVNEIRSALLPAAETWVTEVDGDIVAFVALLGNLIGGLFTHPDHQGRGLGKALVDQAAASHDPLYVEVFEANIAAREFYRHRGFVDHERRTEDSSGLPQFILRLDRDRHRTPD